MKVYLAGPFWSKEERENVEKVRDFLRSHNIEVFVPMEHFVSNGELLPNDRWAREVFRMDLNGLNGCNLVLALYYGHYSDTGTAWEMGYAEGIGIPVICVHVDTKNIASIMPVTSAKVNMSLDELLSVGSLTPVMINAFIYDKVVSNMASIVEQK